ncbi:MAG: hypothetical protein AAFO29_02790, partial [Actinomycetota bacterium]
MERFYPIGTPGVPWNDEDRERWFRSQSIKRSYRDEVLAKIRSLSSTFRVADYGALSIDPERYPLRAITIDAAGPDAPWALITGGVHGYETSGVQVHPVGVGRGRRLDEPEGAL